jgi:hypothetical protein
MDTTEELPYQPSTRAPPPTGPVPLYARSVQRIFPYSLRPIVIYSSLISLIYLVVLGIADFRYATREGVSGKLKIFEIVQGILFIFAAGVEALGFFAAYSVSITVLYFRRIKLISLPVHRTDYHLLASTHSRPW